MEINRFFDLVIGRFSKYAFISIERAETGKKNKISNPIYRTYREQDLRDRHEGIKAQKSSIHTAAGISGALTGADSIPKDLIKQADYATSVNPYTNSKRLLRENSDGLYNAFKARLAKMKTYIQEMDAV